LWPADACSTRKRRSCESPPCSHFLTLSLERYGKWFHLARYHDPDREAHGPEALGRFLGLGISEVFPIEYDIRRYAEGAVAAVSGTILSEPSEKLSRAEIIALAGFGSVDLLEVVPSNPPL